MARKFFANVAVPYLIFLATFQIAKPTYSQDVRGLERELFTQLGTLYANSLPQYAEGKLFSCAIDFGVLTQDYVYRQGGLVLVGGSFGVMAMRGKLATTLKLIVRNFDPKSGEFLPDAPATAYFIFDGFDTSLKQQISAMKSDTPGGIFVIYNLAPTGNSLVKSMGSGKVELAFARKPGGADVRVPVEIDVEETSVDGKRTRGTKAAKEFGKCIEKLMAPN